MQPLPDSRIRARILVAMCLGCLASRAHPQAVSRPAPERPGTRGDPESILVYRTVPVADGVFAFITPEERTGFQSGNSIAIIGAEAVLVFDTGNIPSSTRRQIAEIRRLTDKPVRYVVNSHWHPDHNLGNHEYRVAFPGVSLIGTTATRTGILENVEGYIEQLKGFGTTDSLMKLRLSTGKLRDGSVMPDTTRLFWTNLTRDYDSFLPEVTGAVPLAPDVTFDDSLTISLGRRQVRLFRHGRANTAGDAIAFIPDAGVVLTGDLVTMPCPFPSTSYFGEWIAALDFVKSLHPNALVPGHGEVQHDARYVDLVHELLEYTTQYAQDAVRKGVSLEQAQKDLSYAAFLPRFTGGDELRRQAFNNFYASPALPRAYQEAKYLSQRP